MNTIYELQAQREICERISSLLMQIQRIREAVNSRDDDKEKIRKVKKIAGEAL